MDSDSFAFSYTFATEPVHGGDAMCGGQRILIRLDLVKDRI
jgi:hypothetical protein